DPGGRPAGRPPLQNGRVRENLRGGLGDHILDAGLPIPRATALPGNPAPLRPARPLEEARRPHRRFPRFGGIPGVETVAPPLLRSFSHGAAFRAGSLGL
ncbi:MAG: Uncharacterized protein YczJ, partial [uncultured Rubrobacteraceae bacterium]